MTRGAGSGRSLCGGCDDVVGLGLITEELAPEILEAPERSRRHRHPAPTLALAIKDREHECDAGPLARESSDHLGPTLRLVQGPFDQIGVAAPSPVFFGESEMDRETLEVLNEAGAVRVCQSFVNLKGGGNYCFSIADADKPWVPCDNTPLTSCSMARRVASINALP